MKPQDRIIVALDTSVYSDIITAIEEAYPYIGMYKVGLEAVTSIGLYNLLSLINHYDIKILLDLKLHDIPNTMAKAAANLANFKSIMGFTLHSSAGFNAMKAVASEQKDKLTLAVTILTSIGPDDAWIYGCDETIQSAGDFSCGNITIGNKVVMLANQAYDAGIRGIVCSARDLRNLTGVPFAKELIKVTPGIRPKWAPSNDQVRFATPSDAIKLGADMIVMGRPILQPPPGMTIQDAVESVIEEIDSI
jgi:orotidine-5'-phosphate decarboxylase